jgi:hypothetical protein
VVDRYSTKFEDSVSKRVTEITVVVAPDARREIGQLVDDVEAMVQRCVRRFIWTRDQVGAVKGDTVEFLIDRDKILELFADLRRIDMNELQKEP